jgi:hypothetical protein
MNTFCKDFFYLCKMDLIDGFKKIINVFNEEDIGYMIVGGFATSFYNQYRFTADIDIVLQIYTRDIEKIVKHFPDWLPFLDAFKGNAARGIVFNLTDFETGVKYDFMVYQDSDYNWTAFERRHKVKFNDVDCYIASPEDLVIAKLMWYNISKSGKQLDDIKFLLKLENLDKNYIELWTTKLFINRHGLF